MTRIPSIRGYGVGVLATVGALLFWSIGPIFIKYLTGHFDAWTQNFYRYLVACLVLLPVLVVARHRGNLDSSVWRRALLPALLNVAMQCGWASSLYHVNPGFMVLLTKSSVVWTAMLSFMLFEDERPLVRCPAFWIGVLLAFAGLVGVTLARPDFSVAGTGLGVTLVLGTSLLWAAYTVSARAAFRHINSVHGFAVICVYTVIGLGAIMRVVSRRFTELPVQPVVWMALAVSGVLPIAVGHALYYAGMKRIGATVASLILLASPAIVLAISSVRFGERLVLRQWPWAGVLLAGCVCAILARPRKDEKPETCVRREQR